MDNTQQPDPLHTNSAKTLEPSEPAISPPGQTCPLAETDEALIHRTRRGDRFAAQRLAERHRRLVTQIAFAALGNTDDAHDVAQESLVYMLQRLPELRDAGKFTAWLRQLTLSLCVDYRRRRGTRRLGEPITLLNEAREETDFADRLQIRKALAHLSDAHRTTVLLHYVGGWSLQEVAALLSIPVNTVRSRLMAARRSLRTELQPLPLRSQSGASEPLAALPFATLSSANADTPDISGVGKRNTKIQMTGQSTTIDTIVLTPVQTALLDSAFPHSRILSVQESPEMWMPFHPRVRLALADGTEKEVDFRADIDPGRAELLQTLLRLGIAGPRLLAGPVQHVNGGFLCLCEVPQGENLLLWALGGTPHRIRLATERAFEAIDRLQDVTPSLLAEPSAADLPRKTLTDELDLILSDADWNADPWLAEGGAGRAQWRLDPWFLAALARTRTAVQAIQDPLVYTHHTHFFPNFVRVQPSDNLFDEPLGWPGDRRYQENPIAEYVLPFGYLGDPLLGLAMVWVYDCYPFVHTGFVEQFLWRRGVGRREFAPRLAIKALQMIARDLPAARPITGADYWDALHGWVEQALAWL